MSLTRWPERQLRHISEIPITNGLGESGDSSNPKEWPRYIRTTDIKNLFELHEDRRVTLPEEKATNALVEHADILMTAAGATVGKSVQYVDVNPACYAGYLVRWRVNRKIAVPRFMAYWTESLHFWDQIAVGAVKSTIENFSASKYRSMRAPVPSLAEQQAIADYLDGETRRIDELIAEQRGLIETLRERRVARISRAVRRGLNESVELSQTGIDWLGEVPAHWEVRRLKYSMESVLPGVWGSDPQGDETDVLCVRVADFDRPRLQVREEIPTVRSVQMSDRVSRSLEPEDLLIEKSGGTAINPVGFVVMYTGPSETAVYANFIARMRLAEGQVPRYWLYAHAASYATRLTARSVKQTTGIQNLDQTSYFDEKFPFPPADEQRKIAEYLDDQTSRIDALIAESEDLIALSLERRAALITAAVTGQVDVRTAA